MQGNDLEYFIKVFGADEAAAALTRVQKAGLALTASTNKSSKASADGAGSSDLLADSQDKVKKSLNGATNAHKNYMAHIAKTTVLSALVNKGFMMMVESMGKAVQQADLIANFPASMGALGLSTVDAADGFAKLKTYIQSVGGDLTKATNAVTRFAGVNRDIKASVVMFAGLNNALIAGGGSALVQEQGLEQMIQAYSRGRPEVKEFRSALVAMAPQLEQVATKMGYINAESLKVALTSGKESMNNFMVTLAKMGAVTGPIVDQALVKMRGIQFAATVMQQTLTNGLTAIYVAVGRENIVGFIQTLTQVIYQLGLWVVGLINGFISLFNVFAKFTGMKPISQLISKDAGGIGNASDGIDDIGSGLDDASDSAKELGKSLAGFDKMNVLPEKASSKGKDDAAGGGAGQLDPGQAAELAKLFDEMGKKIQEVSGFAKILAGILASFAGLWLFTKAVGAIVSIVGAIKTVITWSRLLGKAFQLAGTFGLSIGKGLLGLGSGGNGALGSAATLGAKIGLAIRGGIVKSFSVIGTILSVIVGALWQYIGVPIYAMLLAVAGFFGITVGTLVAIIVAVVAVVVALIWLIWTNWESICKFVVDVWNVVWKFITDVFTAFWDWLVGLWNTLYDIFAGPIKWIWEFIVAMFILIVAVIAIALELICKLVVWVVTTILGILATIALWIYNNVIMPVVNFFIWLWKTIVDAVTAAWKWIFEKVLAPIGMWIYNNVISPVFTFFKNMWDSISGFVSGFVKSAMGFLLPIINWIKTNIIDKIAGFFVGLWNGITSGINGLVEGIKTIFNTIVNIIKTPINGIIDGINSVLKELNKIKVPDWVPLIGGSKVSFPLVPKLAQGGVVTKSTLANIGESGAEAIVPLENNTEWIDKLAAKINASGGGNGQPIQLTVQIGEERIVTKIIDLINEKTKMGGRNTVLV